jgi:hypothetical protein
MNHIFVLSYCGADQFFGNKEFQDFDRSTFYFIDNGNQTYINTLSCWEYKTSRNIGCAGGWNLISKIAFDYLNLDKIIITQDDAYFTEEEIEETLEETTEKRITGLLAPHFEFSCFAISKETYKTVGAFDENFLWVYSEDADYKQRCRLMNITVNSLYVDPRSRNQSLSVKSNPKLNKIQQNRNYLHLKWGNSINPSASARADSQAPFEYDTPFKSEGDFPIDFIPHSPALVKEFKDATFSMPSKIEYTNFLNQNKY